jgi:formylglycine-generating enzyme required for sulfatase activity
MKKILTLIALSLFLCSTASALQGGGGESTKKGSSKKKAGTKKTSGTPSANTTRKPPTSAVPTRTPAPAITKEQAADRERQYEAIRIAAIAERSRVEQWIAGEWLNGASRLTITKDGSGFSALYVSGEAAESLFRPAPLPQNLSGELLADNQLRLVNVKQYGKIVNPFEYYQGDFAQQAWIELGVDGSSLIVRFGEAKGGRSIVMKRIPGNADSRVSEAATVTSPPSPMSRTRTGAAGIEFVLIPEGEFMMGSTSGQGNEEPVHRVKIGQPFYLGKYEVTQGQWQAVMGNNPSYFKNCDKCPVEQVSWSDAQQFLARLNERNDGFRYRLPSEAEWEYACRAGTTGDYAGELDEMAYDQMYGDPNHPVGTKKANAWGLYDMHGNVWEWCQDWYHDNYNGASADGSAWLSGGEQKYRVLRGGSWNGNATPARSADRYSELTPDARVNFGGFRVVAVQ